MLSSKLVLAAPALFSKKRLLLFAAFPWFFSPVAAEEIYRCTLADGSVVFQDQRCRAGKSHVIRGTGPSGAISSRSLQQWLDQSPPSPGKRTSGPSRSVPVPRISEPPRGPSTALPSIPPSEYLLSICSEKILGCTAKGLGGMDQCIANIPVCSDGRSQNCCAQPFLDRYRIIRSTGMVQREAVRGALLGVAGE